MTVKQRDKLGQIVDTSFNWLTRIFLAANIFFLSEFYGDWKQVKADIQVMKERQARLETAIEYLKNSIR
jgi:hypothetical protein